jgi:hypothetical protein
MTKLSLALWKYEVVINELHDEVQLTLHMQDEILRRLPLVYVVHTGTTRLVSSPNILDKPMKPHNTKFDMEADMFLQTNVSKFKDVILGMTNDLLDQQRKQTAEVMLETSEAVGNSIDGRDRNIWDVYIEMLQKLDYRFQSFDVYMGAGAERKMKETPQTPEQRQKIQDVIKARREEYLAKTRSRRLS